MEELWKDIEGFENYQISNLGRVKSIGRFDTRGKYWSEKILKVRLHPRGYCFVHLRKDGKYVYKFIHRLVAEAFIPNPNGLSDVKHLDEDLSNNIVYNLQWYDHSHAITYGNHYRRIQDRRKFLNPRNVRGDIWEKPVLKISKYSGKIIQKYDSITLANKSLKRSPYSYSIIECLRGKRKSSGGYVWKYDL